MANVQKIIKTAAYDSIKKIAFLSIHKCCNDGSRISVSSHVGNGSINWGCE